jgi:hypothetical protein
MISDAPAVRYLPSLFSESDTGEQHIPVSCLGLTQALERATPRRRPVLVFDQFVEFVTLFDEPTNATMLHQAQQAQASIRELLVHVIRDS